MRETRIGRRAALKRSLTVLGAAALAPTALAACGGGDDALSCSSTEGLSGAEVATREAQHYVDAAPSSEETCTNCNFFTSAQEGCGTCRVLQGPIHPDGYCDLWVVQS